MKFTPADKEYFKQLRTEDPAVDQLFTDMRQIMEAFPGSKIEYLSLPGAEFGTKPPEGVPYVPVGTTPDRKKAKQMTAAERRRANTRYKQ